MRRRVSIGVCAAMLLLAVGNQPSTQQGLEETINVFGPMQFVRAAGRPAVSTAQFTVDADVHGPFHLTVVNGGTNGGRRVSSARVLLNGGQLYGPSDFNQNVPSLDRDVVLGSVNAIEVELASAPESFLTIAITGKRTRVLSSIGLTRVSPPFLQTSVQTQLEFTSIITDDALVAGSVVLERLNADGSFGFVGTLRDDGLGGDAAMGDRIFTLRTTMNEAVPGELRFRVAGTIAGPPDRRDVSEPVSVFVREPSTVQSTIAALAAALVAGDIDAALTHFSQSPRHRRVLEGLTAAQRSSLAAAFQAARLVSSQGDMRIYEVPWQDDAGPIDVKVTFAQSRQGEWLIISW